MHESFEQRHRPLLALSSVIVTAKIGGDVESEGKTGVRAVDPPLKSVDL